jgi:hypothetical protein
MAREDMNWRIATTEAGLPNGSMVARGIGVPLQPEPADHSVKRGRSQGGSGHYGYKKYRLLWRNLDERQASDLRRLVGDVRTSKLPLYVTGQWFDEANPYSRWVDLRGEPELDDMAPQPPISGRGINVYGTVVLTLNNVDLVNDPATF